MGSNWRPPFRNTIMPTYNYFPGNAPRVALSGALPFRLWLPEVTYPELAIRYRLRSLHTKVPVGFFYTLFALFLLNNLCQPTEFLPKLMETAFTFAKNSLGWHKLLSKKSANRVLENPTGTLVRGDCTPVAYLGLQDTGGSMCTIYKIQMHCTMC